MVAAHQMIAPAPRASPTRRHGVARPHTVEAPARGQQQWTGRTVGAAAPAPTALVAGSRLAARAPAAAMDVSDGARAAGDGLLPVLRKNIYSRMWKAWSSYAMESIEGADGRQVPREEARRQADPSRCVEGWLQDWNSAIHEAGYILRPHLLNQHSAFSHWRYWSHAPQLMTSICQWYTVRVSDDDRTNASSQIAQHVRAVSRTAFSRWEKLHGQTVRAVRRRPPPASAMRHLLLRVVDAWVRLTIRSTAHACTRSVWPAPPSADRARPPDGSSGAGAPEETAASDREAFLNRALEPRATAARPGAHAWALLEAKLQMHHLPGISEHLPRIHSLLQELAEPLRRLPPRMRDAHPAERGVAQPELPAAARVAPLLRAFPPSQSRSSSSHGEPVRERAAPHLHGGLMSLPGSRVCVPRSSRGAGSRGHPIDVVVQRSIDALQPLVARDMAPGLG